MAFERHNATHEKREVRADLYREMLSRVNLVAPSILTLAGPHPIEEVSDIRSIRPSARITATDKLTKACAAARIVSRREVLAGRPPIEVHHGDVRLLKGRSFDLIVLDFNQPILFSGIIATVAKSPVLAAVKRLAPTVGRFLTVFVTKGRDRMHSLDARLRRIEKASGTAWSIVRVYEYTSRLPMLGVVLDRKGEKWSPFLYRPSCSSGLRSRKMRDLRAISHAYLWRIEVSIRRGT